MALTILTGSSQAAATNYSYTTSGSADWASVPTASYFYDITDKTIRFKATNSTYSNVATASFALTASNVSGTVTSASFAATSSYAMNGGVTQLLAGPNVTLSPTNGLGQVTVSATLSGSTAFNTATGSYGSFYDTTTQTNPVANIPRSMSLNTTDITNGVSISGSTNPFNTYIKTQNAGVYNIQFSAQLDKTDSGADEIVIWLRKNGIDLTDTATSVTLTGNNAKNVAAWNWFVNSAANDYYQIIWQSADTDVRLFAEPTDGHPGIPSVIVTANRVDQFLSNTGSFSGSFTGVFTGSLQGTASFAVSASFSATSSLADLASYAASAGTASEANSIATAITDNVDNYILTATGTGTINGESNLTFDGTTLTAVAAFVQGDGSSTVEGSYSHAEGQGTFAGSNQGYLSNTVIDGVCTLDESYGDVSSEYNPGDLILLDDFAFENNYGVQTFTVDTASWDGKNTQITLTDLSVNTSTAIIGNITYGVQNWAGGESIGGQYSHAEGGSTYAIGVGSHTEGDSTEAYGRVSHAEGAETKAIGEYSHAEGYQTQAIGDYSHAEGNKTIAQGDGSHAEGKNTKTIGVYSHAEGKDTKTIGDYSHAEGNNTIASGSYQHVSGQFNTHGDTTSLFIVGNGVDDSTRSDAFKVTPSGSIVLPIIQSSTPSWTGIPGEMIFYDDGAGSYRMFVWLDGGWRSVSVAS
jgi:hypothetical protein